MTDSSVPSVFAAGYVPLDIVMYKGRVWHAAGGTAGNVAAILGFLGWRATIVADLGADLAGQRVRRDLQKANVSTDLIRLMPALRTPRIVHEISGPGHRYRFRCPRCAASFPFSRPLRLDRAREIIEGTDPPRVFFFDRVNGGIVELAEHFARQGSFVVFEPSRRAAPDLMERAAHAADLIKCADDRDTGADELPPTSPRQVRVVTSGASGARYRIGASAWQASPAFSYPVVDAGGAGDWTTAGLVHALDLPQRCTVGTVGDALRWAQALAAVSCGSPGARGLARGQSAEAVLRAAQFLEQEQPSREVAAIEDGTATSASAPTQLCRFCLSPTAGRIARDSTANEA